MAHAELLSLEARAARDIDLVQMPALASCRALPTVPQRLLDDVLEREDDGRRKWMEEEEGTDRFAA